MKKHLLILILLFSVVKGYSCINGETKYVGDNIFVYEDYEGRIPKGHVFLIDDFENVRKQLDSLYAKTKKIEYLSDKGYIMILEGKYQEALSLYLQIESKFPGRYSTASNIGTIYELLGENQKALEWINKAIKINPNSHQGSEWLHSKILEAKIKGEACYNDDFFIGVDFGKYDVPVSNLSNNQKERLVSSLYFQLNERISFIKPKDKIIGILLFELGNLSMLDKDYRSANEILKMAKDYGCGDSVLDSRIAYTNGFLAARVMSETSHYEPVRYVEHYNIEKTILLILCLLPIPILLIYFIRKRMKRSKSKAAN
ncbi:tetratricopeptide repeat protein [Flavobacterium pedocola]